jgi:membrane protease YdiL (CAAX protease family)
MLAVYAPAIAAFATLAVARGRAGLAAYARRFLHWKAHPGWYAAVLLGIPASMLAARAIVLAGGGTLDPWPAAGWTTLLGVALLELVRDPGPVEEVGWRGFALPLLQRRMSAAAASAVLGVVWGVWHLPAFFVQGAPQDGYPFVGFVVGSVAVSLLMTAVYNGTRGSIPLAFLFHYATNDPLAIGKQAVALPWLAIVALLGALALARLGPARLGSHKITDVWQGMTP